jgi:mannose-6-phosphate isomerase
LRGAEFHDEYSPEDWVGSTTTVFGQSSAGLSVLPDGRLLRDAVAADSNGFLGAAHVHRYGSDPALLVKLLDAAERLPVHCHPDRGFAQEHLGMCYGKTEGWLIVEARGASPSVHLGFCEEVEAETLAGWVERQERERLLEALHELPVASGDWVFVPAGLPHAIDEGVFLVELQEPSDLSALLEWDGFAVDGTRDGHLGLGFDEALGCVTLGIDELAALHGSSADGSELRPGARRLLPPRADAYFRAERLRLDPVVSLGPGFSILVLLEGPGRLETEHGGTLELRRGETVLVPHGAGAAELTGTVEAVRCLPPPS